MPLVPPGSRGGHDVVVVVAEVLETPVVIPVDDTFTDVGDINSTGGSVGSLLGEFSCQVVESVPGRRMPFDQMRRLESGEQAVRLRFGGIGDGLGQLPRNVRTGDDAQPQQLALR